MYVYVLAWFLALLVFPVVGYGDVAVCHAGRSGRIAEKKVKVYAHVNTNELSIDKRLSLNVELSNDGDLPVYVYGEIHLGFGGGLLVYVKDAKHENVRRDVVWDALYPPPSPGSGLDIFVKLENKGDFFGTRLVMPVRDLVPRPGAYYLRIRYLSPLSCGSLKFFEKAEKFSRLPILWREAGPMYSPWVRFRVTREKQVK